MTINCKTYECDVSDTFITIEYDTKNKNFWIKRYYIDPIISDSNLFGILLSSMIVDMKRKSMLNLTMTITLEEWEIIKKNICWSVVNTIDINECIEIKCSIDDAFDCLLDGFSNGDHEPAK